MAERIDVYDDDIFAVESSWVERQEFEDLADQMTDLKILGDQGTKNLPFFKELQNDAFTFFNKNIPVINEDSAESVSAHREIIRQMEGMEETQALKNHTVHNNLSSAIAVRRLNQIVADLPDDVKYTAHKNQCNQRDLENQRARVEQLRKYWKLKKRQYDESGDGAVKDEMDKIADQGAEAAERFDQLEAEADESAEALEGALEADESGIRVALRNGLSEAVNGVKAVNEAMGAFGTGCGTESGMPAQIPEIEALKMAEHISGNEQLKKIAEIAGRMQRLQEQTKKQKVESAGGGIVGITSGGEINKLTSTELAAFATPETELMMWQRVVEEKAEVWKTEANQNKGMGPMIVLQDGSGSTAGDIFNWESGMALALRQECAQRGQPFYWIHFDIQTEFRKFDGEGQELEAAEWAQTFMGGGTNPAQALFTAMDCLQDDVDFSDADVVLFSDGIFSPPDVICAQFRNKLDEFGARCMGVYMGGDPQQGIESTSFGPICDQAWNFDIRCASAEGEVQFLTELFSETSR